MQITMLDFCCDRHSCYLNSTSIQLQANFPAVIKQTSSSVSVADSLLVTSCLALDIIIVISLPPVQHYIIFTVFVADAPAVQAAALWPFYTTVPYNHCNLNTN